MNSRKELKRGGVPDFVLNKPEQISFVLFCGYARFICPDLSVFAGLREIFGSQTSF